jgi:hypothetical protein
VKLPFGNANMVAKKRKEKEKKKKSIGKRPIKGDQLY